MDTSHHLESDLTSKRFVGLMNAYGSGMSGGDARFIEIVKRISMFFDEVFVITSRLGEIIARRRGTSPSFLITSFESKFDHVIFTYLMRTIKGMQAIRLLRDGDTVYSSSDFIPDVVPAVFFKLMRNVKYVQLVFHLIPGTRPISHCSQRLSHLLAKRFADFVIVDNELVANALVKAGFAREKVVVNPLGVDSAQLASIPPFERRFDATFLGRLVESKGVFDLVRVWKMVSSELTGVRLAVIGQGNEKIVNRLNSMIVANGLKDNVILFTEDSVCLTDSKFGLIKGSKIFIFPSHEEGFGMALLEALTCGIPVVAWNLPSYSVSFSGGIVKIPMFDFHNFAKSVVDLLTNQALRIRLSQEGLREASKYDWNKIVKRELQVIAGDHGR